MGKLARFWINGTSKLVKLGSVGINFSISKSRAIAIAAIVALLIILAQLFISCSNSGQIMKVVGSCQKPTSIRLIEESKHPLIEYPDTRRILFDIYAKQVSQHLFAKIDATGQCQNKWGEPEVELKFVYSPVIGVTKFDPSANFNSTKSPNTQILDSPWVKMRIEKSSKLVVQAIFFWNERQFLFDQSVLSSKVSLPIRPLLPLDVSTFVRYRDDYTNSVEVIHWKILNPPLPDKITNDFKQKIEQKYQKDRFTARANISKRLPIELIWLFEHSGISGDIAGDTSSAMYRVLNRRYKDYITLTKTLLDRRLSSEQQTHNYVNILDLKDLFDTNEYRINDFLAQLTKEKNNESSQCHVKNKIRFVQWRI